MNRTNQISIYGVPTCSGCKQAEKIAKDQGFAVLYTDVSNDDSFLREMESRLPERHKRGFPQIFIDDEYIGDYNDFLTRLSEMV